MRVEKLRSKGGIRISELLLGTDPCTIERLSLEGETLVGLPGLELNYDVQGDLLLVVVRMVEFVTGQGADLVAELPAKFWKLILHLQESGVEVVAEINLFDGGVDVVQVDRRGRDPLGAFDLVSYNGSLMPIEVRGSDEEALGMMGFQVELSEQENRLTVGVGDVSKVIWTAHPLTVKMGHLDGPITLEKIGKFLKGK